MRSSWFIVLGLATIGSIAWATDSEQHSVSALIDELRQEVRRPKSPEDFYATTEERHADRLIRALAEHGKEAVPPLTDLLMKEPDLRFYVMDILARIGPDAGSSIPRVSALAMDTNGEIRAEAIGTLGKIGKYSPAAIGAITNALTDPFQPVRAKAVRALAEIGSTAKEAVPALISAWQTETDESVQKGIIDAFGLIGSQAKAAVPILVDVFRDKDPSLRWSAARSLGRIGPSAAEALPALEAASTNEADYVRKQALEAIQAIRRVD
ncbi:MAG: HEAT repeat domain-containing protein [Phycisphaerae bacterium]|nr:HEAT repeat domain-containing protein [Phycisphaerae bacterium]